MHVHEVLRRDRERYAQGVAKEAREEGVKTGIKTGIKTGKMQQAIIVAKKC